MPETAIKYAESLIEFGYHLGNYYKAYPLCKSPKLLAQGLHCATFDKKWVFAYKVGKQSIIIYHIRYGGEVE